MDSMARSATLFAIIFSAISFIHPVFGLERGAEYFDLSNQLEFIVDESEALGFDDITRSTHWQDSSLRKPQPQRAGTPVWIKLTLTNADVSRPHVLTTPVMNYSDIRIYRPDGTGGHSEFITGNRYPAFQREIDTIRYSFNITPSDQEQTIYLRVVGGVNTDRLPWVLLEQEVYQQKSYAFWVISLLTVGALLGILIFNAGIGFTLRNKNYLYYSAYILCSTLSLSNLDGLAFVLLWPTVPEFNYYATDVFTVCISITRLMTIVSFLGIKQLAPRCYIVCKYWILFLTVNLLIAALVGFTPIFELYGAILWVISLLLGLVISLYAIRLKARLAIPMFFILLVPLVGSLAQAMVEVGLFAVGVIQLQLAKITFVIHALLFSICIALQMKHEMDARIIAQHDGLTGLPGLKLAKDYFYKTIAMAGRYQWQVGMLFIDLDGFKEVNDTHGHEMGDKLLVEVAGRIQACIRDADTVARIGGDEFLVIQAEIKKPRAVTRVAEKITGVLSEPFVIDGLKLNIGASIGIALYPDHSDDFNELMKLADQSMYAVKKHGKNSFHLTPVT